MENKLKEILFEEIEILKTNYYVKGDLYNNIFDNLERIVKYYKDLNNNEVKELRFVSFNHYYSITTKGFVFCDINGSIIIYEAAEDIIVNFYKRIFYKISKLSNDNKDIQTSIENIIKDRKEILKTFNEKYNECDLDLTY